MRAWLLEVAAGVALAVAGIGLWALPADTPIIGRPPLTIGWVLIVLGMLIVVLATAARFGLEFQAPLRRHRKVVLEATSPIAVHPLSERLRAVSGETLVREAMATRPQVIGPGVHMGFGKQLPVGNLLDLKLAEVALLRRLTTRLERKRAGDPYYDDLSASLSRRECESILTVGGIADPKLSLIRLEQRHLIRSENGEVAVIVEHPPGYSGGGGKLAYEFTECLLREPVLLAGYRKVSLSIDKVISTEPMSPVVGEEVTYENWLGSISL